jgi:glycosyltransferase involved in cell wall biosynthesis
VFGGEDADGGVVRRHAAELGLHERVRFLGRLGWSDFLDLIAVTDIGINLRLPPTNGETSGALLNLLAAAVPTIVTDVATFADYPGDVVRKVRWETEGPEGLRRALFDLAGNAGARHELGRSAWEYVTRHHEWSLVAKLYAGAIERSHRERSEAAHAFHLTRPRVVWPAAAS